MGWFKKATKSVSNAVKKIDPVKAAATVMNVPGAGGLAVWDALDKNFKGDVKNIGQQNLTYMEGLYTGQLGKSLNAIQSGATSLGEMTGLVPRQGDKPTGIVDSAIPEAPKPEAITEDANDALRKRLGSRFASRQLFGGGGQNLLGGGGRRLGGF